LWLTYKLCSITTFIIFDKNIYFVNLVRILKLHLITLFYNKQSQYLLNAGLYQRWHTIITIELYTFWRVWIFYHTQQLKTEINTEWRWSNLCRVCYQLGRVYIISKWRVGNKPFYLTYKEALNLETFNRTVTLLTFHHINTS